MSEPFCSRLAVAAHGVIAGTGVPGEIYVFLPVRKTRWGRREFNESWASPDELDAIGVARKAGVVVRLYDPPPSDLAILVHRGPAASPGANHALRILIDGLRRHAWALHDQPSPTLALCTQGTRDRCCAKWGFALFRAARALHDAGEFAYRPIECSHLGGDRFAATGIVFPSGTMYGHLDQLPLADLAQAEAEERVLQGHYRGRVFEPSLTQVVRAGLAGAGFPVTTVSAIRIEASHDQTGPLRVVASGQAYDVFLSKRRFEFYGDCRAAARVRLSHDTRLTYDQATPVAGL